MDVVHSKCVQAAADLARDGYAVIPGVLTAEESAAMRDALYTTLEDLTRATPTPWLRSAPKVNPFPGMKGIIMEPSELSHAKPVWDARKATLPYFADLWGTGDLVSSYDRVNVMPAVPLGGQASKMGQWLHSDQTALRPGLLCVQGFLDLCGTGDLDAGLVVAAGSHLQHRSLLLEKWKMQGSEDWTPFDVQQHAYIHANFEVKKVQCPQGSLVLWDSRTFHQNTPPQPGGHARAVIYTCMMPRAAMKDEKDAEKKRAAFTNMRATSHWPQRTKLFGKHVQTYGKPSRIFDTRAVVIQQPDPASDSVVASLTAFSSAPADSYQGAPLLQHAPFSLLHMNKLQLFKMNKIAIKTVLK